VDRLEPPVAIALVLVLAGDTSVRTSSSVTAKTASGDQRRARRTK
jgi:hypothetical protein